jgi:replication factor A2
MDYQGSGGFGNSAGGMASPPGSAGGAKRGNYDDRTIQPLTIRMAMSAVNDPDGTGATLDDRKLFHIKLVGAIRSFQINSSNAVFDLEDGTGLIRVKQWLNDQNECTRMTEMREQITKENIYVKVIGELKAYDGDSMLVAESIRPVSSGNEIAHHMLDVVHSAELYKRKNQYVAAAPHMGGGVGFGGSVPLQAAVSSGTGNQVTDDVLNFFRNMSSGSDDVGPSVQSAAQQLGQYPEGKIRQAIEFLCGEGTLYSTTDEDHYKCAI